MKKIAVIGTGQQGASIAQALANAQSYAVSGYDASESSRTDFAKLTEDVSLISTSDTNTEAVKDADIIILATPIDRFGSVLNDIADDLKTGAIITDVGSGKVKSVLEIKQNLPANTIYVPAHPIVGKAQSGTLASDANMYQGETIVVVPQSGQAEAQAQITIEKMWSDMGGNIAHMNAITHDRLYGTISHFEHVAAFSLVALAETSKADYQKAGNTMLDTTRIAGGASADMWLPIFRDNNAAVLASAQGFLSQLDHLKEALNSDTPAALEELLKPAHEFRKRISEPRARESLEGEVYDIAEEFDIDGVDVSNVSSIQDKFNASANTAMIKRTLIPTILGAAITLNAKDTEENHLTGVEIVNVANPSFKDGSAPMLNNPAYVAGLLFYNRDELQERVATFEQEFDVLFSAIRDNDADAIRAYIDHVSELRKELPAHRSPEEMRDVFTYADDEPQSALG